MIDAYAKKLDKDFGKCKNGKEIQKKLAYYEHWNDYLDGFLSIGGAAAGFGVLALSLFTGYGPPHADKFGHFAKGLIANRGTGWLFNKVYRSFKKIDDADDDVREELKPLMPRVAVEGASTVGSAYLWEVLQRDVPAFPGSVYDEGDMFADGGGHVFGSMIEYELAWRRKHQYDAASKRLEELGKKPLPRVWNVGFGGASPKTQ